MKNQPLLGKINVYALYGLATLPLLPHAGVSIVIIIYATTSILRFFLRKEPIPVVKWKYLASQLLFYGVFCFSILYSENTFDGLRIIQHSLPLLVFPLLSTINQPLQSKELRKISKIFIISSIILALYIVSYLLYNYGPTYTFNGSLAYHVMRAEKLYLEIHPIYTTAFFHVSILLVVYNYINEKKDWKDHIIGGISVVILLLPIIILASKGVLFILAFSLCFLILFFKGLNWKPKIILLTGLFFTILIALKSPMLNNRIQSFFNALSNAQQYNEQPDNSTTLRIAVYDCSFQLIRKNLLWGYGIGDVQEHLNECLNRNDIVSAHNWYLRIALSSGIFTLLLFLYSLAVNLNIGRKQDALSFVLVFQFIFLLLIEDYLIRSYGVVFYASIMYIIVLKKSP